MNFKKILMATIAISSLTACTAIEGEDSEDADVLRLMSNVTPTRCISNLQTTQIAKDVNVGVFAVNNDNTFISNHEITADGSGSFTTNSDMKWGDNEQADIYAYAPYSSTWQFAKTNPFSVAADQRTDENYLKSDLLYSEKAAQKKISDEIAMQFCHKLTKIYIKLTFINVTGCDGATVSILNTKNSTTFKPNDGTITEATGNTTNIITASLNTSSNECFAIIIPQTIAASTKFIEIKLTPENGGTVFYYTLPSEKSFEEGKKYTFDLQVNGTNVSLKSGNITDWTGDDITNGETNVDDNTSSSNTSNKDQQSSSDSNLKDTYTTSDFIMWDKTKCANCPTADQIQMYLGAGVYWDDGTITGNGLKTYKVENEEYHAGLWIKKKQYIDGFNENSSKKVETIVPTQIKQSNAEIRTNGQYFFLPAIKCSNGSTYNYTEGKFWSISEHNTVSHKSLSFKNSEAKLDCELNSNDCLPWIVE